MRDEDNALWAAYTRDVVPLAHRPTAPPGRPPRPVVAPLGDAYLDLHGMPLHDAWKAVRDHVLSAALEGKKRTLVVTGLSGAIRQEFPRWVENLPRVREATATNGNGAFVLRLRRRQ